MVNYKVQDKWSFNENGDDYCLITRIDNDEEIVHIAIKSRVISILHVPMGIQEFSKSVRGKIGKGTIRKEHLEAINIWDENKGGIWAISINDIIEKTVLTLKEPDKMQ